MKAKLLVACLAAAVCATGRAEMSFEEFSGFNSCLEGVQNVFSGIDMYIGWDPQATFTVTGAYTPTSASLTLTSTNFLGGAVSLQNTQTRTQGQWGEDVVWQGSWTGNVLGQALTASETNLWKWNNDAVGGYSSLLVSGEGLLSEGQTMGWGRWLVRGTEFAGGVAVGVAVAAEAGPICGFAVGNLARGYFFCLSSWAMGPPAQPPVAPPPPPVPPVRPPIAPLPPYPGLSTGYNNGWGSPTSGFTTAGTLGGHNGYAGSGAADGGAVNGMLGTVPEPGAWLGLVVGVGLLWRRRR